MKAYDRLFIGGEWVSPSGTGTIDVINPTTEQVVGRVPDATEADVDKAVALARDAFDNGPWPRMTPVERAEILTKVSQAIQADMQAFAELITTEMGSPVSWATMAQVFAPTMILDYYAGLASTFQFDEVRQGLMGEVLVAKEPVGVVGAISPWNVPMFIAAAKLAPGTGGRVHGGVQAGARDPSRRLPSGRGVRAGGPAQGRVERAPSRARGR